MASHFVFDDLKFFLTFSLIMQNLVAISHCTHVDDPKNVGER